jgi:hypothetical protein
MSFTRSTGRAKARATAKLSQSPTNSMSSTDPLAAGRVVGDANLAVGIADANALQDLFETQQSLTTHHEQEVQSWIEFYRALREGDLEVLKARAKWNAQRNYVPDPLPEKISETFADMLYGEDPVFKAAETVTIEAAKTAAIKLAAWQASQSAQGTGSDADQGDNAGVAQAAGDNVTDQDEDNTLAPDEQGNDDPEENGEAVETDQDRLDAIVDANELPAELHQAEMVCSSEGEVWWRIYVDPGQSDYPIIEWHSRSAVRPMFRGRKLIATAFSEEIHRERVEDQWTVWRYVEIQAEGYIRNLLYKGNMNQLGTQMPLDAQPQTANLKDEWIHNLGMLCGRVYNKLGRDRRVGRSDYHNVWPLMLSLNEATTVGHENMRLTAKKRLAVPREAIGENGNFDASEDVLIMDEPLDDQLGANTANGRFAVLEYSFDAQALIEHKLDQIATILGRVGIVADMASSGGRSGSGGGGGAALSGTALRMRLIPTTLAANGKARPWDSSSPQIMVRAQQVDALPVEEGGCGHPWNQPNDPPSIERGQPLPSDETEETNRHVAAVGGEIESRRTAIRDMHPDWEEEQVAEELDEIMRESKEFAPPVPPPPGGGSPFGGNAGAGGNDEQG